MKEMDDLKDMYRKIINGEVERIRMNMDSIVEIITEQTNPEEMAKLIEDIFGLVHLITSKLDDDDEYKIALSTSVSLMMLFKKHRHIVEVLMNECPAFKVEGV